MELPWLARGTKPGMGALTMNATNWLRTAALAAMVGVVGACGQQGDDANAGTASEVALPETSAAAPGGDLVQVAVEAGNFTTLVQAVEAAGLVEVLRGEGPFTVFAPTDEAFARLPEGTLEGLLQDREALRTVLTYHVLPERVTAEQVISAGTLQPTTVQGETLSVAVRDGQVRVDEATVVTPNVMARNGVIHAIDQVVLPAALR
jgi:uncharacterized surface protein with fasciclin (FAS1) repeats